MEIDLGAIAEKVGLKKPKPDVMYILVPGGITDEYKEAMQSFVEEAGVPYTIMFLDPKMYLMSKREAVKFLRLSVAAIARRGGN